MKHNLLLKVSATLLLLAGASSTMAQQKIGGTAAAANANAFLELDASGTAKKGLLNARLALSSTASPSPLSAHVAGMLVYNTTAAGSGATQVYPGLYYNDGSQWVYLNKNDWQTTGNTGTTPSSSALGTAVNGNYWGTTDAQNLVVGVNGQNRMIFDQNYNATGGGPTSGTSASSYNFSWGTGNSITSRHSVAFGNGNTISSNQWNAAIGNSNSITGFSAGSMAFGTGNTMTASAYTYMFGNQNTFTSDANLSFIAGSFNSNTILTSNNAVIFGDRNIAAHSTPLLFGNNITTGAGGQTILKPRGTSLTPSVQFIPSSNANSFNALYPGGFKLFTSLDAPATTPAGHVNITGGALTAQVVIGNDAAMAISGTTASTPLTGPTTTVGHSALQVAGSVAMRIRTVNAAYTVQDDDYTVVNTNASTITLPTAVGRTGRIYIIVNESAGNVPVTTPTNQLKTGTSTGTTVNIATAGAAFSSGAGRAILQSDGAVWHWIGN